MSRPLSAVRSAKLRRLLTAKEKAGKLYAKVHARTAELIKITPPGAEIAGPDGKVYTVVDNFAGRVAFKTAAIDHFEVKAVDPKKAPR